MSRPRLLVVASTFPARRGDGTPSFVWDLAEQEAVDFDVTVLVPRVPGAPSREVVGNVTIIRFPYWFRSREDLAYGAILENLRERKSRWLQVIPFVIAEARAIRSAVRSLKPDLVHVHWLIPQGIVARLVVPRARKVVTTLGGDVYALRSASRLKASVVRNAVAVTVMNEDMKRRLVALGADATTTHVIPMGAEVDAVRRIARERERTPGRLLFAGRMVEKKGVPVLLDAVRALPGTWSLDLVGDGPLRVALESSAPAGARFVGTFSRERLAQAFGECSIFVLPSIPAASGDQDGLPVVLLEAMAAGCAVVASRLPGIDEVIEDGVTGLLVAPGDASALRDAIALVSADAELAARLGEAASKTADRYSVAAIGARYRALLGDVVASRT